jgi:hypothetical protein
MPKNSYRCDCGKVFKTAQGLAGHQRFCKKTVRQSGAEGSVAEWAQKFSEIEENYESLLNLCEGLINRLKELEKKVDLVTGYVCPAGKNLVGVTASRIIELSGRLSALKSEMDTSQKKLEREIKGWVWDVIPERFRPKL